MFVALLTAWALQTESADELPNKAYVVVECVAGQNETVENCRAVEVSHPDQGLEDAALSVARRARVGQRQGVAVGKVFRIKIVMRLAEENEEPALRQSTEGAAIPDPV